MLGEPVGRPGREIQPVINIIVVGRNDPERRFGERPFRGLRGLSD
jgi:hypothetical protein